MAPSNLNISCREYFILRPTTKRAESNSYGCEFQVKVLYKTDSVGLIFCVHWRKINLMRDAGEWLSVTANTLLLHLGKIQGKVTALKGLKGWDM
jgi:hypothetical protein